MSEQDREIGLEEALAGLGAGAGVLAGPGARIANKEMLRLAKDAYRQVYASQNPGEQSALMNQIWEQTGWYQGPDGSWKFEIPEAGAKYKFLQTEAQLDPPDWSGTGVLSDADRPLGVRAQGQLADFLDFPALYEAYPGLETMQAGQIRLPDNTRGVYSDQLGVAVSHMLPPEQAASTLTHEIQHVIQGLEGFGRGGNPEEVGQFFPAEAAALGPEEAYRRLAGEVESRMAQKRLWYAMGPDTAYSTFPLWDQSIPSAQQLVYSTPPNMPPVGKLNALQLPQGRPQHLLLGSLPAAAQVEATIPETSLGSTGRALMSLLKRALK